MNLSLITTIAIILLALGFLFEAIVRFLKSRKSKEPGSRVEAFNNRSEVAEEIQTPGTGQEESEEDSEEEEVSYDVEEEGGWEVFSRFLTRLSDEPADSLHEIDVWFGEDDSEELILTYEIDSEEGLKVTMYQDRKDLNFNRKLWAEKLGKISEDFGFGALDKLDETDDESTFFWFSLIDQSLDQRINLSNRLLNEIYLAQNPNKKVSVAYLLNE
jgi:hypothetical protein